MRQELKKISYKIEKSREEENKWLVVRYCESKRGCSIGKIFEGTRKQCREKIEEIKNGK